MYLLLAILMFLHISVVYGVYQHTKNEALPEVRLVAWIPVIGEIILLILSSHRRRYE